MSATFQWSVTQMQCYPQAEGETDVVFNVAFSCSATQTNGGVEYVARYPGYAPVTYVAGSPYTPYDQLTQEQVLGWVWGTPEGNQAEIEAKLQAQIDAQIAPPVVTPPLPWATA